MSCTEDFLEVDLPEKDESSTSIFIIASPLQVPPLPQVRCYLGISYPWKFLLFLFGEKAVRVFGLRNPKDNPWAEGGAEFVVESTGVLTDMDKVASHLKGKYLQAWSVMVAPKSEIGSLFENNFKAAAASVFPDDGQVDSPLGEAQKLLGGSFMKRFPLKDPRIQVVRNLFLTSEPVSSISWRSYYILTMDLYVFPTPYMITWDYYFETREHILMNQSWETRQIWNMLRIKNLNFDTTMENAVMGYLICQSNTNLQKLCAMLFICMRS